MSGHVGGSSGGRPYRFVLRAYPAGYRRIHGEELADTAHELAAGRWSARESAALLVGGLRIRALLDARSSVRGAWTSGVAAGVMLWLGACAWYSLVHPPTVPMHVMALNVAMFVAAMVALELSTRWPTALAISALYVKLAAPEVIDSIRYAHRPNVPHAGLGTAALPVLAIVGTVWLLALAGDGRPARGSVLTAAIPAAPLVLALSVVQPTSLLLSAGSLLACLVLARVDPRPLIAAVTFSGVELAFVRPHLLVSSGDRAIYVIFAAVVALAVVGWLASRRLVRLEVAR